jgi:hypothetical protein
VHYAYWFLGEDTPPCCNSHLVEILFFLDDLFAAHQIPYFGHWGTHIGALRHGGLIPWDTDVDVGIPARHRDAALDLIFGEAAQRYDVQTHPDGNTRVSVSARNALHVDVAFWTETGDPQVMTYARQPSGEVLTTTRVFPLVRLPFYGRELPFPGTHQYLIDFYGPRVMTHGYRKYQVLGAHEFPLRSFEPGELVRGSVGARGRPTGSGAPP